MVVHSDIVVTLFSIAGSPLMIYKDSSQACIKNSKGMKINLEWIGWIGMNGGNQEMGISYFFGFFDPGLSAEPRVSRGRKAVGVRTKNRLDAGRGVAAFASFWPSPEYSGISYMFR